MNVVSMMNEIHFVSNPMIGEPSLPYLSPPANDSAKLVRIRAFDQLNSALDCHVHGGSKQQMHVVGHDDKRMQFVPTLAAMPTERLQEKPHVRLDNKQPAAIPSREGHKVSSRRGEESSRLKSETSAAESRTSLSTLNRHEWNSRPSRLFFLCVFSFWESAV